MRSVFAEAVAYGRRCLAPGENYTAFFEGEDSDFIRFNRGKVRQPGSVRQAYLKFSIIRGKKQAFEEIGLSGVASEDQTRIASAIGRLRTALDGISDDPYLIFPTEEASSETRAQGSLPAPPEALAAISEAAGDRDFVGIYAQGWLYRGFSSSFGQNHWYENKSFNLSASFYADGDKAVKWGYAGQNFSPEALIAAAEPAARKLPILRQPIKTIAPGEYRVFLAPDAVDEWLQFINWNSFGLRSHKTKATPWLRLIEGKERLNPAIRLTENTAEGVAPNFDDCGFLKPAQVPLLENGGYGQCLVSARSAGEYGAQPTGSSADEEAESFDLAQGNLPIDRALRELGTGVYVSNVWYLNNSDKSHFRATGMTRYATCWVENGEIVAPLAVMRFDESVYRMFGDALIAATAERQTCLSASSYSKRSTRSAKVPGLLLGAFRFTL